MPDEIHKNFVNAFLKFLKSQILNENFKPDIIESLEVAVQCLEAAYELDNDNENSSDDCHIDENLASSSSLMKELQQKKMSNNIDLFELYQSTLIDINPEKQNEAENIKNDGNRLMKEGKFYEALLQYNKAIRLDPTNPVFYCNRAAAYTRLNEYNKAITDCQISLSYNPNYGKAYGRMGVAYSNLNKIDKAFEAYKRAIELEPDNQDYAKNLQLLDNRANKNSENDMDIPQTILKTLSNPQMAQVFANSLNNPLLPSLVSALTSDNDLLHKFHDAALQFHNDNPSIIDEIRQQVSNIAQQVNSTPSNSNINMPGPSSGNNDLQQQQQQEQHQSQQLNQTSTNDNDNTREESTNTSSTNSFKLDGRGDEGTPLG